MKAKTAKLSGARRTTPRLATLLLLVCAVLTTAEAKDRRAHASEAIEVVANIDAALFAGISG